MHALGRFSLLNYSDSITKDLLKVWTDVDEEFLQTDSHLCGRLFLEDSLHTEVWCTDKMKSYAHLVHIHFLHFIAFANIWHNVHGVNTRSVESFPLYQLIFISSRNPPYILTDFFFLICRKRKIIYQNWAARKLIFVWFWLDVALSPGFYLQTFVLFSQAVPACLNVL